MKRFLSARSLYAQIAIVSSFAIALMYAGAILVLPQAPNWVLFRLLAILTITGLLSLGLLLVTARQIIAAIMALRHGMTGVITGRLDGISIKMPNRELEWLKLTFDSMVQQLRTTQSSLAARTASLQRLVEFGHVVQPATTEEAVFSALSTTLRAEFELAAVAISIKETPDAEAVVQLAEPVAVDASKGAVHAMTLDVGPAQVVLELQLGPGEKWTDEARGLAETYAATARGVLTSLHHLAQAHRQSMTDPLTGLYNRRSLDLLLQREVLLADRHGRPLSVVMIDLDHFKTINDTYGHAAGDHLLKAFADCCRATLRKSDLAFRLGGDEFLIALPQTSLAQAEQVVHKLRQAFAGVDHRTAVPQLTGAPTLSIGVAERCEATMTQAALLSAADHAVYAAKRGGRDRVHLYSPTRAA